MNDHFLIAMLECASAQCLVTGGFPFISGDAIVTLNKAALWTDGRYFLQASMELDDNWTLQKSGL